MYIYQNDKLYAQLCGGKLVGVDIHADKIVNIMGTETILADKYDMLTMDELQLRFNIKDTPYIFPQEKVVVEEHDTVRKVKSTPRKSTRK